jgi:hypothetical protein
MKNVNDVTTSVVTWLLASSLLTGTTNLTRNMSVPGYDFSFQSYIQLDYSLLWHVHRPKTTHVLS